MGLRLAAAMASASLMLACGVAVWVFGAEAHPVSKTALNAAVATVFRRPGRARSTQPYPCPPIRASFCPLTIAFPARISPRRRSGSVSMFSQLKIRGRSLRSGRDRALTRSSGVWL